MRRDLLLHDHPIAAVFPMMGETELAQLTDDIREHGLREPIVIFEDMILDGRNRFRACERADVEPRFEYFGGGDPVRYVVSLNLHRRHLNESQRGMVAARLATLERGERADRSIDPSTTQASAAEMLNVSVPSVKRAREVIDHGTPELVEAVERGEIAVSAAASIVDMEPEEQAAIVSLPKEERREAIRVHVSNNSGNNEWYTPPEYIEAARAVMGAIDCDPASSDFANETVKAGTFYTIDTDGLTKKAWGERVWMNPPYGQPLIEQFCEALVTRYDDGRVTEACVLVNNATETGWFQHLLGFASAVCFIRGRIRYMDETGARSKSPLQGQAVLYFGDNADRFTEVFSAHGCVLHA